MTSRRFERILLTIIAACLVVLTVDRLAEPASADTHRSDVQRVLLVGVDSRISVPVRLVDRPEGWVTTGSWPRPLINPPAGTPVTPGGGLAGTSGVSGPTGPGQR